MVAAPAVQGTLAGVSHFCHRSGRERWQRTTRATEVRFNEAEVGLTEELVEAIGDQLATWPQREPVELPCLRS